MNIKELNALKIEAVELTYEEFEEAIREGKRKKFFHLKHKLHWDSIAHVEKLRKTKTPESAPAADGYDYSNAMVAFGETENEIKRRRNKRLKREDVI